MAAAQIQRLFNNARSKLPGAIDDMLKLELFNVLNEFYTNSNIWQEDVSVPVTSATATYTVTPIVPDTQSIITRLMWIYNSAGVPVAGTMQIPGTVILQFTPTNSDTLKVTVAKTVIDPVTAPSGGDPLAYGFPTYPTWTMDKYFLEMLDGLIGRMMSHLAKPYSNEKMAVYHLRKFTSGIATARNEAARLNVYGAQRWSFPQGFAVPVKGINAW